MPRLFTFSQKQFLSFYQYVAILGLLAAVTLYAPGGWAQSGAGSAAQAQSQTSIDREDSQDNHEAFARRLALAAQQADLSQRLALDVCLIHHDVEALQSLGELRRLSRDFDSSLRVLQFGSESLGVPMSGDSDVLEGLEAVASLWEPMKTQLLAIATAKTASRADVERVAAQSRGILLFADLLMADFRAAAAEGSDDQAQIALMMDYVGQERRLGEQAALEYCLWASDIHPHISAQSVETASLRFSAVVKALIYGDKSIGLKRAPTTEINAQQSNVRFHWDRMAVTFARAKKDGPKVETLAELSENMVKLRQKLSKARTLYIQSGAGA